MPRAAEVAAGTDILAIENGSLGRVVFSCSFEETCRPTRFQKDGKRVYMVSNAGAADLTGLYLLDLASGESSLIHEDPEAEVDFGGALFSDASEELEGVFYVGNAGVRTYALTDQAQDRYDFLVERLPEGARHVFVLNAVYGYSHEESSDMLGIAVGTSKAQLHRARKLLSQQLRQQGFET